MVHCGSISVSRVIDLHGHARTGEADANAYGTEVFHQPRSFVGNIWKGIENRCGGAICELSDRLFAKRPSVKGRANE
jgi:hypothetical protein